MSAALVGEELEDEEEEVDHVEVQVDGAHHLVVRPLLARDLRLKRSVCSRPSSSRPARTCTKSAFACASAYVCAQVDGADDVVIQYCTISLSSPHPSPPSPPLLYLRARARARVWCVCVCTCHVSKTM